MTQLLPETDPAESVVVEFDFEGELEAIGSATLAVSAINGSDPDVLDLLDGTHQITGTSVFQRITPGVDKINYMLRCVAADGDDVRVRAAILPVRFA